MTWRLMVVCACRRTHTLEVITDGAVAAAWSYDRVPRDVERPLIAISLAACRGNQIRASQLLGLNRNTLRKKIRELGVELTRGPKSS